MTRLEELTPGVRVAGVLPPAPVIVVAAQWHGTNALTLTYRADDGTTGAELLYRDDEAGDCLGGVLVRSPRPP